jgi:uncharacterized protein (DUF1501 family)
MNSMPIDRRTFLKGCCAASLAAGVGKSYGVFAAGNSATQDTLVFVFLRGAMDALSLVSPGSSNANRAAYEANRIATRIPDSGSGAGLPIASSQWNLHPRATGLNTLFSQGDLGIVVGAGQMQPQPVVRSHFEAQNNLDLGLGGGASGNSGGWLTRHLLSAGLPANVPVPAVSMGDITATSLLGSTSAITMGDGSAYRLNGGSWQWNAADNYTPAVPGMRGLIDSLPDLWQSSSLPIAAAGLDALGALSLFRAIDFNSYSSNDKTGYQAAGGANYALQTNGGFGTQLQNIAQLIKRNVGLRIATVDLGGWDTHDGQGSPTQGWDYFGNQMQSLSDGLNAFYTDLAADSNGNYMQHVTVVTVSEFGRRVLENASGGTDHGYGTVILALGGSVNGGKIYGTFPGLADDQLFEGADVGVTTDYRQVLSEALIRRLGNPHVYSVFPNYTGYAPLGIFAGTDLTPTK